MPSPLAHSAVALTLWPMLRDRRQQGRRWQRVTLGGMLMLGVLGPDLDIAVSWMMTGKPFVWHGGGWHSLFAGAVFGVVFAVACQWLTKLGWGRLWLIGSAAWWSHVVLDVYASGRGVALLWPLVDERIASPVVLFYGVRHSEPWALQHHVMTLLTELPFVLLMWLAGCWVGRRVSGDEAWFQSRGMKFEGQNP